MKPLHWRNSPAKMLPCYSWGLAVCLGTHRESFLNGSNGSPVASAWSHIASTTWGLYSAWKRALALYSSSGCFLVCGCSKQWLTMKIRMRSLPGSMLRPAVGPVRWLALSYCFMDEFRWEVCRPLRLAMLACVHQNNTPAYWLVVWLVVRIADKLHVYYFFGSLFEIVSS